MPNVANYIKLKELRLSNNDVISSKPELEEEILKSIDEIYYQKFHYSYFDNAEESAPENDQVAPDTLILTQLPEQLDLGYIITEKTRLKKQLFVVSKRVSDLILKNQENYERELSRVTELQQTLNDTIKICKLSRKHFAAIQKNFTFYSLQLVNNYRKKERLKEMVSILTAIRDLREIDKKLKSLANSSDLGEAVELCTQFKQLADNLQHYKCVEEMLTRC